MNGFFISEKEFRDLAGDIRDTTGQILKEVKKMEKKVYGSRIQYYILRDFVIQDISKNHEGKCSSDYKDIFQSWSSIPCKISSRYSRYKILLKGVTGTGKRTFLREILSEWTIGKFRKFPLVIFVSFKLANPRDKFEDTIIQQNYCLKDCLSSERLGQVLNSAKFGNKCLLLIDGLEKHDVANNRDLLDIIEDKTLCYCNVIFNMTSNFVLEERFQIIVTLTGAQKDEARFYVSSRLKMVNMKDKIDDVLNIKFNLTGRSLEIITCPMLLRTICFLVQEHEIVISEDVTLGFLYYRLILCLYTKAETSETKGLNIEDECRNYLVKFGKLALENLWFRKLLTVNHLTELGEDYGLISGLISKCPESQYIMFEHSTIQQFFGAYYIIHSLKKYNTDHQVDEFLDMNMKAFYQSSPLIRRSPYLFEFCNWASRELNFEAKWREWVQEPAGLLHLL